MPHIYKVLYAICIHKPLHSLITLSLLWFICQFVHPPILSPEFLCGVPMTTSYDMCLLTMWSVSHNGRKYPKHYHQFFTARKRYVACIRSEDLKELTVSPLVSNTWQGLLYGLCDKGRMSNAIYGVISRNNLPIVFLRKEGIRTDMQRLYKFFQSQLDDFFPGLCILMWYKAGKLNI